jgi:hypothetical protein
MKTEDGGNKDQYAWMRQQFYLCDLMITPFNAKIRSDST